MLQMLPARNHLTPLYEILTRVTSVCVRVRRVRTYARTHTWCDTFVETNLEARTLTHAHARAPWRYTYAHTYVGGTCAHMVHSTLYLVRGSTRTHIYLYTFTSYKYCVARE